VEPVVKETYGMEIRDVLNRIDSTNKELGDVRKELNVLSERIGVLNERTKIMLNMQYVLIGGTIGTLVSIILMLIRLLT
jgi:CHASE3 domain sensor protein